MLIQSVQDPRLDQRLAFYKDNNPEHTAKTMQEELADSSVNVLESPRPGPDLNPTEQLLKLAAHQKPTELDRISTNRQGTVSPDQTTPQLRLRVRVGLETGDCLAKPA